MRLARLRQASIAGHDLALQKHTIHGIKPSNLVAAVFRLQGCDERFRFTQKAGFQVCLFASAFVGEKQSRNDLALS